MIYLIYQWVTYNRSPTWFIDCCGIAYAFRTDQLTFMVQGLQGRCTLADGVTLDCIEYIRRCGDIEAPTVRGPHWYNIDGVDRQNKTVGALYIGDAALCY